MFQARSINRSPAFKYFARTSRHVDRRDALADVADSFFYPRRKFFGLIFEIHHGDVFEGDLDVFDQDGKGASRHGTVTDDQNSLIELYHDLHTPPLFAFGLMSRPLL